MGIALAEARRMKLSLPGLALAEQLYRAVAAQGYARKGTHALMLALASLSTSTGTHGPTDGQPLERSLVPGRGVIAHVGLEDPIDFRIESALSFNPTDRVFPVSFRGTRFLGAPEENVWPVVDEAKDVAKWGARSAGCAAASAIARNDAICPAAACQPAAFRLIPRSPRHRWRDPSDSGGMFPVTRRRDFQPNGGPVVVRHRFAAAVLLNRGRRWDRRPLARRRRSRSAARAEKPRPGRVFAASRLSIDEVLTRPYDRDVPMGCTGDRVWASSPQGWAFRDDVHWLYLTNLRAVRPRGPRRARPARARSGDLFPSHIHYEGVRARR